MILDETGHLFVDACSPTFVELRSFLVSCCEPICRTRHIHEYRLTSSSLSAASAEGTFDIRRIREVLAVYCSNAAERNEEDAPKRLLLPAKVEEMLAAERESVRLRVVLQPPVRGTRHGRKEQGVDTLKYFLVCDDHEYLDCATKELRAFLEPIMLHGVEKWTFSDVERFADGEQPTCLGDSDSVVNALRRFVSRSRLVYKAQVCDGKVRQLREALSTRGIRIDCYYDYAQDSVTPAVENFSLQDTVRLRPYQEASLERFQRNGKAHHGVVVLPCGAGKTLTGIAAAAIVKRRTLVMCINKLSAMQWYREFLKFTTLSPDQVTMGIEGQKDRVGDIFITTYTMLTAARHPRVDAHGQLSAEAAETARMMEEVQRATWGMLLLDEVHTMPAEKAQNILNLVKSHCVLGLSATLLREDEGIENLRFLVGPKLYEANWLELIEAGHLSKVTCAEVQCPLPPSFLAKYLTSSYHAQREIGAYNPYKLWVTQALIEFHQNQTPPAKVIVFCDSVAASVHYARRLGIPVMSGETPEAERANLVSYFKDSPRVNAIVFTRVGDVALDIPEASVIIQVTGLGGSRRQEAQRLGRIMRPKPPSLQSSGAFFYSLVSQDTIEVTEAMNRQEWLKDQGFPYRVLHADEIRRHHLDTSSTGLICAGPVAWSWLSNGDEDSVPGSVVKSYAWVDFAAEHSQRIEDAFLHGRPEVVLHQRKDTNAQHAHSHAHQWATIRFESTDAPRTFGTIFFTDRHDVRRRVRRGLHVCREWDRRNASHDCLQSCVLDVANVLHCRCCAQPKRKAARTE